MKIDNVLRGERSLLRNFIEIESKLGIVTNRNFDNRATLETSPFFRDEIASRIWLTSESKIKAGDAASTRSESKNTAMVV